MLAKKSGAVRTLAGVFGAAVAAVCLIWLVLGLLGWVPAMVDVFGVAGMRTPAAFTVGGLLVAAIAFRDWL